MWDKLTIAFRELCRRRLRTIACIAGYIFASALVVTILFMLEFDIQTKDAAVRRMGGKFLVYSPVSISNDIDNPEKILIDHLNEGFFAEPMVVTRLMPRDLANQIGKIPEVKAATPFLLFRFKQGQDGHIFSLGGIRPEDFKALKGTLASSLDILSGTFFTTADHNVVVIDKSYADIWKLKVGSVVNVANVLYPVVGIVSSHARTARADIYMNWSDAEIAINKRLKRPLKNEANIFLVETMGAEFNQIARDKVEELLAKTMTNAVNCSIPVVEFMGLSRVTLKLILIIVVMLVLLFAANSQWTTVSERRHDIAILKAIGWRNSCIFHQIILESLIQALIGGITGSLIGYVIFTLISKSMDLSVNQAYYVVNTLTIIVGIILTSVLVGVISGMVSAYKATNTRPADILRNS